MKELKQRSIAILLILFLVGILPIIAYWLIVGRVPFVTAQEAMTQLEEKGSDIILVDVRDEASYAREHVDSAVYLPLAKIQQMESTAGLPQSWSAKELLIICDTGYESAKAARRLLALGVPAAHSVRGGMQEWSKAGTENPGNAFSHFSSTDQVPYLALRPASGIMQALQVLTGFVIKPVHMVLSILLIWILVGAKSLDLSLAKWALVALFIGEAFCALNFLLFQDDSLLFEHFHNWGMIMAFTLVGWAFMEGLEERVLKLSAPQKPCAIIALCGKCDKLLGAQCKGRQMFKWIVLALIVLAFIPLTIEPGFSGLSSQILGTPYFYSELFIFQLFEARYLPLLAIFFFLIAWFYLRSETTEPIPQMSRIFVAAGLGCLGFGVFRLGLNYLYEQQALWFSFWEEATELLFVAFVAIVLWTFRQSLLGAKWSLREQFNLSRVSTLLNK